MSADDWAIAGLLAALGLLVLAFALLIASFSWRVFTGTDSPVPAKVEQAR